MLKEPDAEDLIGEKADNFRDFQTYINQLENFITSEDFDDKTEEELKEKGIDIQSFVKWYLVYEITGNWEPNHPKSCYMTYYIVDSKSILKMGLIWDFDLTLLQEKPYEHFYIKDSIYYSYFFKNNYFVSELKRIWSENFYNQKKQLFTRIEDNIEKLRLSAKQDIKLYSKYSNSSYVVKLNDFDAYIDHNVNFLEKRFEWLNNAISQL